LLAAAAVLATTGLVRADVIDDSSKLQEVVDESLLDLHGDRFSSETLATLQAARAEFGKTLGDPEAQKIWAHEDPVANPLQTAGMLGALQARLQHVAALEMIAAQRAGQLEEAKEWRSIIMLPKYASAVDGALALQRMGGESAHQQEVSRLLAREYAIWQITRAREKTDSLIRLIQDGRATPGLVASRASEIEELSAMPASLLQLATGQASAQDRGDAAFQALLAAAPQAKADALIKLAADWRLALEAGYPNLLSPQDIEHRERVALKLLRLIPLEFQSGVRAGEVTIPLEYAEAKSFTVQTQQVVNELMPVWRQTHPQALEKHGPELLATLAALEQSIKNKVSLEEIEKICKQATGILQSDFGLAIKKQGTAADVVSETTLEIRAALGQSLAAAQNKQWRQAEQFRQDAYIGFDLEIESRTLPRDPTLAIRSEKTFLDGSMGAPGIKAALDSRLTGDELAASYQRALDGLDQCSALLKVGLSPMAAIVSAVVIIVREGLEAVVILAALLAGLRGVENTGIRKRVGMGAWMAVGVSLLLFVISRTLLQGLSRYGETLEAVISIVAVVILLMVTNWVFHKYYWTGWNSKLRDLSKAAQRQQATRFESLALVGVGFMTIFREGFEITLFMQSLILEAGMRPVIIGLAVGGGIITALGVAVFQIGARLPYRKMLMATGVLVVFVLFTFMGSTVRLFQTVGWMPVHPIPGFELPVWTGIWLGLYPTWEGMLIPFGSFFYVGAAWLFVKLNARREQQQEPQAQQVPTTKTSLKRTPRGHGMVTR